MKRLMTLVLAALMIAALAACSGGGNNGGGEETRTPEEYTELYVNAIENCGSEMVEYNLPVSSSEDAQFQMTFDMLGVSADDLTAYAVSLSPMNVKAYTIALLMPAEGKEDTVLQGVNDYVDRQKKSFETYLMDQYEIASAAKVETLDDGTIVLVMDENADTVYTAITDALK